MIAEELLINIQSDFQWDGEECHGQGRYVASLSWGRWMIESRSEIDGFSFIWNQVPVSPGFAITDLKSQGRSVNKAIIDRLATVRSGPDRSLICRPLKKTGPYSPVFLSLGNGDCKKDQTVQSGIPRPQSSPVFGIVGPDCTVPSKTGLYADFRIFAGF
jgi:hypothetical protein